MPLPVSTRRHERTPLPPSDAGSRPVTITVLEFDGTRYDEYVAPYPKAVYPVLVRPSTGWIHLDGSHDAGLLERLGERFGIHPLVIQNVVRPGGHPRTEALGGCLCVLLRRLRHAGAGPPRSEQVSLLAGPTWVISVEEQASDAFDGVRQRLRDEQGRTRQHGAGYLLYRLVEAVLDDTEAAADALAQQDAEGRALQTVRAEVVQELRATAAALDALPDAASALRDAPAPNFRDAAYRLHHLTDRIETMQTRPGEAGLPPLASPLPYPRTTGTPPLRRTVGTALLVVAAAAALAGVLAGLIAAGLPALHARFGAAPALLLTAAAALAAGLYWRHAH
ncbi:MAG: CorA family divalent cation transporter [Rhodothermales bacterium]|nr:CorA family divalent cation transporter [Rhodothermales bacterium]